MTSPEDHWFVRREQRQVGPLNLEQLQELARRGVLQASDLIRKPDSETWVAAQEVPALLGPIAVGSIGAKGVVALDGPVAAKAIVALGGSVAPNDAVSNGDIKPPPLPEISPSPPPSPSPSPSPLPTPLPQVSNLEVSYLQPPLPGLPAEPLVPEMPSLETPNLETPSPETPSPETPSPETPRPDMPALSSLDDWETDEEIRQPNYFVRHWRGELPLHVSFWFSGIVGFIPVAIVVTLVSASPMLKHEFAPAWMLLAIVSAWLIAFAAVGWQVVGAWRSAGHYQRQRQPGGWGGIWGALAKVALAAAALCTLFIFGTAGVAQVRDYYKIYAGDGRMGQHALRITRDGRELEFSGGISLGVAKEFAQVLSSARSLQTVHLNSAGGRIVEADRIAALIKARGLDTYVADKCASACTNIFLSGRNRLIAPGAKIGFHQHDFPGWTAAERERAAVAEEAKLRQLGASATFAKRATATPPEDMWYPPVAELLSEKIVTRVVDPSERNSADRNPSDQTSPGMGPPRPITGRSLRE